MKQFKRLNSNGFSAVEILVVAVVLALVGAIGYSAWQKSSVGDNRANNESGISPTAEAGSYLLLGSKGKMDVRVCRATRNGRQQLRVRVTGHRDSNFRNQRVTNITFQGTSSGLFFPSMTGTTQKELTARYPVASPNFSIRLAWEQKHSSPYTGSSWSDKTGRWTEPYNSIYPC